MSSEVFSRDDQNRLATKIGQVSKEEYVNVFNMLTKGNDSCFQKSQNGMTINLSAIKPSRLSRVERYIDKLFENEKSEDEIDEMVDNQIVVNKKHHKSRYVTKR